MIGATGIALGSRGWGTPATTPERASTVSPLSFATVSANSTFTS